MSTGLDSGTLTDIVTLFKAATDVYQGTVIVSLLQPPPEVTTPVAQCVPLWKSREHGGGGTLLCVGGRGGGAVMAGHLGSSGQGVNQSTVVCRDHMILMLVSTLSHTGRGVGVAGV
jgi:hypothetical protein